MRVGIAGPLRDRQSELGHAFTQMHQHTGHQCMACVGRSDDVEGRVGRRC